MDYKYSPSTGGFYREDINGTNIPVDAVGGVSESEKRALQAGEVQGKLIVLDANGRPALQDRPAPSLADLKTAKNADINAERAKANAGTFAHGGKVFACDALSRSDIDGVNGFIALTGALPPGFPGAWKAVDNTYLPIADVAAWTGFYGAMVATGSQNFAHAQQLKAALAAATTAEQVAAITW